MPAGVVSAEYCAWPTLSLAASFEEIFCTAASASFPASSISPHVADVEQAGLGAHRQVLVDDARVLHRHVPSAKRHHARAMSAMPGVQRRFLELFGGRLVH